MRRSLIHANWLVALLATSALPMHGQEAAQIPDEEPEIVVISEKSAMVAGALEWIFPTVGYAYAGNWVRGLPSAGLRIGGLLLALDRQSVSFGETPPCQGQCVLGLVMAVGGTIWAIVGAGSTARHENDRRRAAARGVQVAPTFGAGGAGVGVRVALGR